MFEAPVWCHEFTNVHSHSQNHYTNTSTSTRVSILDRKIKLIIWIVAINICAYHHVFLYLPFTDPKKMKAKCSNGISKIYQKRQSNFKFCQLTFLIKWKLTFQNSKARFIVRFISIENFRWGYNSTQYLAPSVEVLIDEW